MVNVLCYPITYSHYANHEVKHALSRRLHVTPKLITIVGKIRDHTPDGVAHPVVSISGHSLPITERHTLFQAALSI